MNRLSSSFSSFTTSRLRTSGLGHRVAGDVELLREAGEARVVLLRPLSLPGYLGIPLQPGARHRQPPRRVRLQALRSGGPLSRARTYLLVMTSGDCRNFDAHRPAARRDVCSPRGATS